MVVELALSELNIITKTRLNPFNARDRYGMFQMKWNAIILDT